MVLSFRNLFNSFCSFSGYETDFGVSSTDAARVSTRRREHQLSLSISEV